MQVRKIPMVTLFGMLIQRLKFVYYIGIFIIQEQLVYFKEMKMKYIPNLFIENDLYYRTRTNNNLWLHERDVFISCY